MYVCICHAVTDDQIRAAARERGVSSMRELRRETGCAGTCGQCAPLARSILQASAGTATPLDLPVLDHIPAFA